MKKKKHCKFLPSIANANARSACNKVDQLNQVLEDTQIHIMCITETWITPENKQSIISQVNKNYSVFSNERSKRVSSGTMVLVNNQYAKEVKHRKMQRRDNTNRNVKHKPAGLPRGFYRAS
jgi:hypothetical protein